MMAIENLLQANGVPQPVIEAVSLICLTQRLRTELAESMLFFEEGGAASTDNELFAMAGIADLNERAKAILNHLLISPDTRLAESMKELLRGGEDKAADSVLAAYRSLDEDDAINYIQYEVVDGLLNRYVFSGSFTFDEAFVELKRYPITLISIAMRRLAKIIENSTDSQIRQRAVEFFRYFIRHKLEESKKPLSMFFYRILEQNREVSDGSASKLVLFAETGAEPLLEITQSLAARMAGYDPNGIRPVFITSSILESKYNTEHLIKYLYDIVALNYRDIYVVDTGFKGSVVKRLRKLLSDKRMLSRVERRYGIKLPHTDYEVKGMILGSDSDVIESLQASGIIPFDYEYARDFTHDASDKIELLMLAEFIEDGIVHSYMSPKILVEKDGIVSPDLEVTKWPKAYAIGSEVIAEFSESLLNEMAALETAPGSDIKNPKSLPFTILAGATWTSLGIYCLVGVWGVIVPAILGGFYLAQLGLFYAANNGWLGKYELINELQNKAPPTKFWRIAERDRTGKITNVNERIAQGLPQFLQRSLILNHETTIHNAIPVLTRIPFLGELIAAMLEIFYLTAASISGMLLKSSSEVYRTETSGTGLISDLKTSPEPRPLMKDGDIISNIRRATIADAEDIGRLSALIPYDMNLLDDHDGTIYYEELLSPSNGPDGIVPYIWVYTDQGSVKGYAYGDYHIKSKHFIAKELAVDNGYQGRGIGSMLTKIMLRGALDIGARYIEADLRESKFAGLFSRLGFLNDDIKRQGMPGYYRATADSLLSDKEATGTLSESISDPSPTVTAGEGLISDSETSPELSKPQYGTDTPAREFLKVLGLDDLGRIRDAGIITDEIPYETQEGLGCTVVTIAAPKEAAGYSENGFKAGFSMLTRELSSTAEAFDLLYRDGRLIAIFPVWTKLSGDSYFDLSDFYFYPPSIGDRGAKDKWLDFSNQLSEDKNIIGHYLKKNQDIRFHIAINPRMHAHLIVKVHKSTGQVKIANFSAESLDKKEVLLNDLVQEETDYNKIIVPILPTVFFSNRELPFFLEEITKYLKHGEEALVVGPGTGIDAWITALVTGKKVCVIGINPFEVVNARVTAKIGGFEIDARLHDNVVSQEGRPVFDSQFDVCVWNMPEYRAEVVNGRKLPLKPKDERGLASYWDGDYDGKTLTTFTTALPKILRTTGHALIWNSSDYYDEVINILRRAGMSIASTMLRDSSGVFYRLDKAHSFDGKGTGFGPGAMHMDEPLGGEGALIPNEAALKGPITDPSELMQERVVEVSRAVLMNMGIDVDLYYETARQSSLLSKVLFTGIVEGFGIDEPKGQAKLNHDKIKNIAKNIGAKARLAAKRDGRTDITSEDIRLAIEISEENTKVACRSNEPYLLARTMHLNGVAKVLGSPAIVTNYFFRQAKTARWKRAAEPIAASFDYEPDGICGLFKSGSDIYYIHWDASDHEDEKFVITPYAKCSWEDFKEKYAWGVSAQAKLAKAGTKEMIEGEIYFVRFALSAVSSTTQLQTETSKGTTATEIDFMTPYSVSVLNAAAKHARDSHLTEPITPKTIVIDIDLMPEELLGFEGDISDDPICASFIELITRKQTRLDAKFIQGSPIRIKFTSLSGKYNSFAVKLEKLYGERYHPKEKDTSSVTREGFVITGQAPGQEYKDYRVLALDPARVDGKSGFYLWSSIFDLTIAMTLLLGTEEKDRPDLYKQVTDLYAKLVRGEVSEADVALILTAGIEASRKLAFTFMIPPAEYYNLNQLPELFEKMKNVFAAA